MTVTVIALVIIGLIFIFSSFFLSEAVADSTAQETPVQMPEIAFSEEQRQQLHKDVEEELRSIRDGYLYQFQEQAAGTANEKMLALGDYAVSVCDEIEKNHKEAMFLYSMLGDKEKELKLLVEQVDTLKQELQVLSEEVGETARESQNIAQNADDFEQTMHTADAMDVDFEQLDEQTESPQTDNANEIILDLKKSGMSIIEIAKQLGLGVGEVKLVVDLYEGGKS